MNEQGNDQATAHDQAAAQRQAAGRDQATRHGPATPYDAATEQRLAALAALRTAAGRALLDEVREVMPEQELTVVTRLRRTYPADLVAAALTQARLRQRAAAKFGTADASRMFFTADGVEQATRTSVATYRATRFRRLGVRSVADLCCGIGGDAIALARAGITVLAVDRSPLTCAVARANADALNLADRIEVVEADVAEVDTRGFEAIFADPARRVGSDSTAPARRAGRGRIFRPEDYSPPLSWAVATARAAPCGALKIAPGIPYEAIPEGVETEWISDGGEVKEAVLWFGTGAPPARRATLLPAPPGAPPASLCAPLSAPPPDAEVRPVGRYVYEPDGAVIRAHLVGTVARDLGGGLLDPTIAYITADDLRPTPYATAYEITDTLPFNLKRLRALLRERGVGTLTVKKRGSAVEPDELRRRLRLQGRNAATVFLTRVAGAPSMLIGHPV